MERSARVNCFQLTLISVLASMMMAMTVSADSQYNTFHYANHPYIKYMGHHPGYTPPAAAAIAPVALATPKPHHKMEDMMMKEMIPAPHHMMEKKPAGPKDHMPHHPYVAPHHPAPYHHPGYAQYPTYHHEPTYSHPMQPYHHPNMYHHPAHHPHHPHHPHHAAVAAAPATTPYHPARPHYGYAQPHHVQPYHHPKHMDMAYMAYPPAHHVQPYHHPMTNHYTAPAAAPHYGPPHPVAPVVHSHVEMKDEEMMMDDHHMMMMDHEKPVALVAVAPVAPAPPAPVANETPMYLGTFSKATHEVSGDIFLLDDHTIYIQGFSFDGQAPDVHFWSDGVAIPYYTRSKPHVSMVVGKYNKEDVVLMLPPEKPTIKDLHHFQVWCRQFGINFGEFSMDNAHV